MSVSANKVSLCGTEVGRYESRHYPRGVTVGGSGTVEVGQDSIIWPRCMLIAVVAAGAVVSEDVEPLGVVGGVPARIIKYRK
jgi:acetyltransferase-like isoleucine patch superfamily enzyme